MPSEISVAEMKARYDEIASANIYDTMDRLGVPNQCMDLGIRPLRWEMHVAGPAFPIYGTREPRLGDELDRPQFRDWGQFKAMTPHGRPLGGDDELDGQAARCGGDRH
jgi:hypothetical protein